MKTLKAGDVDQQKTPIKGKKKPYEAPGIISREPLELVAVACGGVNAKTPSEPLCNLSGNISS
ncbi:hypothetical protein ACFL17_05365 [Pseudomonadota bacterium]